MKWSAKLITHRGKARIAVIFEKNAASIARIKALENARWSQSKKVWHIPDTLENRERFKIAEPVVKVLSTESEQHLEKFIRWMSAKRYSQNTVKTYRDALRSFLKFFQHKDFLEICNEDVITFNNDSF